MRSRQIKKINRKKNNEISIPTDLMLKVEIEKQ